MVVLADPRPIVYLGPSLSLTEAQQLFDADYRPPVKRGDLPQSFDGTIVIIDGEFGQSLSVSPNELLRLLDQGTHIIGASSMGALRAAELHPYGMRGCGWIFEAYLTGRLIADDEVAVTYSPLDLTALTVPLVNVRVWVERLQSSGAIDAPTGRQLVARAKRIFYADRSEDYLIAQWEVAIGEEKLGRILVASGEGIFDIKRPACNEGSSGMESESKQQPEVSPGLIELIGRAITDERFREELYTDQEDATKGYMLTDADHEALANLPRETLDEQARRFGAASATGVQVSIVIKGSF
jgi:TfuA protein